MSVSSVSSQQSPLPFNYLDKNNSNTQPVGIVSAVVTPSTGSGSDSTPGDDAGAVQKVPAAPLPPGQGTRIDQLA
ncbi:MAG TPA: hypothetical protein VFL62_10450 [Bradyrhizobium sp.]|uniref:hypothetical protein n=1 Tax=Bradyrhizobium sp. TaxID=376 RepID=UPI002D7E8298|nr:hypothetical protein [Bradyrhizobium sp.]HET7886636.1 hypothetical protein [Bradyrhizobium sp.]